MISTKRTNESTKINRVIQKTVLLEKCVSKGLPVAHLLTNDFIFGLPQLKGVHPIIFVLNIFPNSHVSKQLLKLYTFLNQMRNHLTLLT